MSPTTIPSNNNSNDNRPLKTKIRGALNKIISLTEEEKAKGVICSSAGNHAQGVAYASSLLGVKSSIVMPETTPYLKVESTKNYGGNIVLHGKCYDDAFIKAKTIEEEEGKVFIHPFNDMDVIYGQGTIALEIFEDINNLDYILKDKGRNIFWIVVFIIVLD